MCAIRLVIEAHSMLGKLIKTIFVSPKQGFNIIKTSDIGYLSILLLILSFVIIVASIVFFAVINTQNQEFDLALRYFFFTNLKWLSSLLISTWAINNLIGGFKGGKNFKQRLILVFISASFFMILSSLGYIFPEKRSILLGFSFIGLIYYFFGLSELTSIVKERITGFLLISLLVFILIVFLFQIFWGLIFNLPIQL